MALIGANGGLVGSQRSTNGSTASGLWTANEQVLLRRAARWPVTGDPFFGNVSLLLHLDGANGSTVFTDSSTGNRVVTRSGDAQISTTQSKFGGASAYFDGTGDFLAATESDNAFTFGTGNFTIEFWVYPVTLGGTRGLVEFRPGNGAYPLIYTEGSNLNYYVNTTLAISGVSVLSVNQWYHVALSRIGTSTRLFLNGNQLGSTFTDSINYLTPALRIGSTFDNFASNAYIDDVRITKGVARYNGGFTVPSAAFLDVDAGGDLYYATTSLLLHMGGTNGSTAFTDSSVTPKVITANGNAQISTAISKFGGTSAALDGAGDWLALAGNSGLAFGAGDFTIEMFVYFNAVGVRALYETPPVGASGNRPAGFVWYMNAANKLQVFSAGSDRGASVATFTAGTWYHIALVRSAGVFSYFIDGVKDATTFTLATNFTDNAPLIGRFCDGTSNMLNGYIDELRVTRNIARYTSNFTAPTVAFPEAGTGAGDNTFVYNSLLLHMDGTNGSTTFTDTSSNALTVTANGNAQISTAQSKFGGASGLFDGTGDYLSLSATAAPSGAENFTVEAWLRPSAVTGADRVIVETRGGSGFVFFINTSGFLQVFDTVLNGTTAASTTALVVNAWAHIALVGNGSTKTYYINGNAAGMFTLASMASPTQVRIGIRNDGAAGFTGYIDDLRITKGVARYTGSFDIPTLPFPD